MRGVESLVIHIPAGPRIDNNYFQDSSVLQMDNHITVWYYQGRNLFHILDLYRKIEKGHPMYRIEHTEKI